MNMDFSTISVPIVNSAPNFTIYTTYLVSLIFLCFTIKMGFNLVSIKKETGKINQEIGKKFTVSLGMSILMLFIAQMMLSYKLN